jgi:hypothetical protein
MPAGDADILIWSINTFRKYIFSKKDLYAAKTSSRIIYIQNNNIGKNCVWKDVEI